MGDLIFSEQEPSYLARQDGIRLAYRHLHGGGPTIIFLPGYKSDMQGGKAQALAAWAQAEGRAMLRLDYSGCGDSEGEFDYGTLDIWRDDVLVIIRHVGFERVILIGSSMGGWLMVLVAEALGAQVAGLVGIAAAPDFTRWGYSGAEKTEIMEQGQIARPGGYGYDPLVTMRAFWESGEANLTLDREIAVDCPVRLLHGQSDADIPWQISVKLAAALRSSDVQTVLVKGGDHRLSRDADIALLIDTVAKLVS